MTPRSGFRLLACAMALAAIVAAPTASADHPAGVRVDASCYAPEPRIDPEMGANGVATNPAWILRDQENQYCATLRLRDQYANPAYGLGNVEVGNRLYLDQLEGQFADGPEHLHGGVTTLIPGSQSADAFRALSNWHALTGGRAVAVSFPGRDGAILRGHVFYPPPTAHRPRRGYPGIVITDGSIQGYENLYYWAAEGLAQYGYEVMTYDVQGQGDSDLLPSKCRPGDCPGVPYQQNYNFYQGAEDALNFFDSARNPGFRSLDRHRLGIAGHSLGAAAVSWVGQCDRRVRTIVAWDDLAPVDTAHCRDNVTVPRRYRARRLHAPALAMTNDYEFNVQPVLSPPDPHGAMNMGGGSGDAGYLSLAKADIDSQIVSIRNGTHLTYTYVPYVLPANELGERFAFYYTLAWFDEYLRQGRDPYTPRSAYTRLTTLGRYDASADTNRLGPVSIGTGTYDPARAAADPTNPSAGNVPYRISGIPIKGSLSFYFYSEFRITDPRTGRAHTCVDMLAGCPTEQPQVP